MKDYNDEMIYEGPQIIKFDEPKMVKLCELNKVLNNYKPFPCADVWLYERFEYGDFDNYIEAIIESKTVDASYSHVYREDKYRFKAGETDWSIVDKFWHYKKDKPFWLNHSETGYGDHITANYIDEIEIKIYGVFVISWSDKAEIERNNRT